jgi:hypothetical protein
MDGVRERAMRGFLLGGILAGGIVACAPAPADAAMTASVHEVVGQAADGSVVIPVQYVWRGRPYRYRWHGGYYAYQWNGGYYNHRRWFHHGWRYY